ncbi:P2X purinoceptor 7-like [Xenia sp. Carnegie-2017]|uniref:P2X purinoceptor 7-like n=1 Tax=Xenia sp. Carnegie-2017 TaxID=2897299 RepID=UPI001F0495EE|nr:P2X purinoceptor 7-like [Xenia sp. Carnegie-2017]
MDDIHENQPGEVLPYQYEPEVKAETSEESGSEQESEQSDLSSSEDEIHAEFEKANALRLQTLSWCKCGHCTLSKKAIECFCCHENALEYDEYEALLGQIETQGVNCLTTHQEFRNNMLSESVLKIDVCRHLEENWPLSDEELARIHKLYRLVAYQRCSRWIFQILGKKHRRPFPACVYASIRKRFASPDGLYTHLKYACYHERP